jgi:hypothetical protein
MYVEFVESREKRKEKKREEKRRKEKKRRGRAVLFCVLTVVD